MTTVTGSLNSNPSTQFTIELFLAAADGSGHGEAVAILGTQNITTDAGGDKAFTFLTALPAGQTLSATATSTTAGNTSEFSLNVIIVAAP